MEKKYELSGKQIRDIAESYAYLACLYQSLNLEQDPEKRVQIAREVLNEGLPNYRKVMPKDLDYKPRRQVNLNMLEETCQDILTQGC